MHPCDQVVINTLGFDDQVRLAGLSHHWLLQVLNSARQPILEEVRAIGA